MHTTLATATEAISTSPRNSDTCGSDTDIDHVSTNARSCFNPDAHRSQGVGVDHDPALVRHGAPLRCQIFALSIDADAWHEEDVKDTALCCVGQSAALFTRA